MENYELLSYSSVSRQLNNRVYSNYYYRLMLIAKALFKWEGLPNNINEKWIENYLYSDGGCIFFKDDNLGFIVTRYAANGKLNLYNEPTKVRAYATDYISTEHENNVDCVIIRNNDESIPTFPTIQIYAHDLTNIKRAIDVNVEGVKMPYIITCTDKQRLTFKNLMSQRKDNEPVIYADKSLDIGEIKVLPTPVQIVFDKLQTQKLNVWNECLTSLGINNANTEKKERMITNEVNANNEVIQICSDVMLKAREEACKRINEMFDLNISVRRRTSEELRELGYIDFDNEEVKEEERARDGS